jgi:hypothetical protein
MPDCWMEAMIGSTVWQICQPPGSSSSDLSLQLPLCWSDCQVSWRSSCVRRGRLWCVPRLTDAPSRPAPHTGEAGTGQHQCQVRATINGTRCTIRPAMKGDIAVELRHNGPTAESSRCGSSPAANGTSLRTCRRRPSPSSKPPSPRAASSTATSEITSATVWLDPRSTEQHQRTISLLAGMRLIRRGRPASFCEGKVGHRNERRIREFLLLDNRNRRP